VLPKRAARGGVADSYQVAVEVAGGLRTLQVHRREIEFDDEPMMMVAVIDITDRVAAEAAFAAAAELHRFLAENASERLIKATIDGVVLYSSDASGCMLELDAADLCGVNIVDIVHVDDRAIAVALLDEARATGAPVNADLRISTAAAGQFPWINISAQTVFGHEGLQLHLSIRDIRERRAAELALAETEAIQRLILDSLDEGVVLQGADVGVIRANKSVTDKLGIVAGNEPFHVQLTRHTTSHEADGTLLDITDTPSIRALRSGHPEMGRLLEYRHTERSPIWVNVDAYPLHTMIGGSTSPVLLTITDISQRRNVERQLEQERQLLHATLASVHAGVLAIDQQGRVIEANHEFCRLVGATVTADMHLADIVNMYTLRHPDGRQLDDEERPLFAALAGRVVVDEALLLARADGQVIHLIVSAAPIKTIDDHGGAVLTIHDVTELRAAESELRNFATFDALTGLPNRRAIVERLNDAFDRHQGHPEQISVLFLDLDGFKSINDTLGHEAGDDLLVAVGHRLQAALRSSDLVGRHGGDEFVIVLEDLDTDIITALAHRIEATLAEPFLLQAGVARVGGSVGTATGNTTTNANTILAAADTAMYETKRRRHTERLLNKP
jgi:diguanylate cyclase (GGDEF)-like protein/PAS domain S-box-containing protein